LLQGRFYYHIDEKGRLKMPAEFVRPLGSDFVITKGSGHGCLWLTPRAEWLKMVEALKADTILDERVLALQRWFVGSAADANLDGQGRLTIPPALREFAGIQHEIVLIGIGDRAEIWARERFDEYEKPFTPEGIAELGRIFKI
jgi:MraZ protein